MGRDQQMSKSSFGAVAGIKADFTDDKITQRY